MRKLRNRLIFHFSLQFVTLTIAITILVIILFFLLVNYIANDEIKRNTPVGVFDGIFSDTEIIDNNKATLSDKWIALLKQNEMWVQVINNHGKVVGNFNTPSELPTSYAMSDIISIEENDQLLGYTIKSEVDNTYEEPYYYILGYKDKNKEKLVSLFKQYNENGLLNENELPGIKKKLKDATIHIINKEGEILQSIGTEMDDAKKYKPLDILLRKQEPGYYSTETSIYHDSSTKNTWILLSPKKDSEYTSITILEKFIIAIIIIGASVFLITVSLSIWNGYRYGQPLFIFTSWLERMGKKQYDEVLTVKERHKIFRKSGKVRTRYRLYREVINAFYEMAERLAASEKEKIKLEKTREEWMTGISHDLRTPLSSIQGYGHLLESGQYNWTKAELVEIGNILVEKSEHMLRLVEDFTLTFQIKNKALSLVMKNYSLNQLVQQITAKYLKDRTYNQYEFHFINAEDQYSINADAKWFERMLDNIIINSIKHNPPGTSITLSINKHENDNQIILQVKDDGVGMDENTVQQLFERYYRGTNTEENTDGSGLGMNIAKGIAELHSAKITVTSELNQGTIINISFPLMNENNK